MLLGTTAAAGDVGTTGGSDTLTPIGVVSAPDFTGQAGTPAGTVAWPAGVPTFAGQSFTPAGTVGTPTFTGTPFSAVVNHTHTVQVTDPGHAHTTQRYPTATGSSSGFTIDTSMSGTLAANTLPVISNSTGISATTLNPGGGVSSITPAGTVSQPTFTGQAGTPAGTVAWPAGVPTFSGASFTPSGTVGVPVFTGVVTENRSAFLRVIFCTKQ